MLARGPLRPSPLQARHSTPPHFHAYKFQCRFPLKDSIQFPLTRQFSFNVSSQTKRVMFTPTQ